MTLSGLTAANILGSGTEVLNIYYGSTQRDNNYLGGRTCAFDSGNDHLIATPRPAGILLLGLGFLGRGRKKMS